MSETPTATTTGEIRLEIPAAPEYLRLARLAVADVGARAGWSYEDIDDLRIAVSELCSVVSVHPEGAVTLTFRVEEGCLTVEGESRTGSTEITPNELSEAIVAAVTDEHLLETDAGVTRFEVTKRSRNSGA